MIVFFHIVIGYIVIKILIKAALITISETVIAGLYFTLLHTANAYSRFSWHLELQRYQSIQSQISSTTLMPTWVNGSSSSLLDVFVRLDQYKKQLLSGVLCINMDMQSSFKTAKMLPDKSPPSVLSSEGLTMHCLNSPPAEDSAEAISSS